MKKNKNLKIKMNSFSFEERRGFIKKLTSLLAVSAVHGGFTNISAKNTSSGKEFSTYYTPEPYLGSISIFAGNFAIENFAICNGQIMEINSNQQLFTLIGSTFGGDGRVTFALPDLRGRAGMGQGEGPGFPDMKIGEKLGTETETLTVDQIPKHTHDATMTPPTYDAYAYTGRGGLVKNPDNAVLGKPISNLGDIYSDSTANARISDSSLKMTNPGKLGVFNTGGSQAHNNMMPYLVLNYQIAIKGPFPPRN